MKKLLIFTLFLLSKFGFSQTTPDYSYKLDTTIFNSEWRNSLIEPINFITFQKPSHPQKVEFRIYRGCEENYHVTLSDRIGTVVFQSELKSSDQIDISNLKLGFYTITVSDGRNSLTKILTL